MDDSTNEEENSKLEELKERAYVIAIDFLLIYGALAVTRDTLYFLCRRKA